MARQKALACAALLLFGMTVASDAADPISIPTSTPVTVPVHDEQSPVDWSGFYAGIYGAARTTSLDRQFGIGLQAGVNAQFDFLLVGAEVSVEGLSGDVGDNAHAQILGRAGLVATDDIVVYAAGGYGLDLRDAASTPQVELGGGIEIAASDDLSIDATYLRSMPVDGSPASDTIILGANFHF